MTTSLWCNHSKFPGRWVPGNGFDQVLPSPFTTIADLWSQISAITSIGSIQRLGIAMHGDEGELQAGGEDNVELVTPDRISSSVQLRTMLTNIGTHLRSNATVLFYSCSAGASEQGSRLLIALSQLWPGRTVVGAITKGYRFGSLTAGDVKDTLLTVVNLSSASEIDRSQPYFYIPGRQPIGSGRDSFFYMPAQLPQFLSVEATLKIAKNGRITHWPSGPMAFHQFEMHYPTNTRMIILSHPGYSTTRFSGCFSPRTIEAEGRSRTRAGGRAIVPAVRGVRGVSGVSGATDCPSGTIISLSPAESDMQFYTNLLINIDHPRKFGENILSLAGGYLYEYGR